MPVPPAAPPEPEEPTHTCQPAALTRELLAARRDGVSHKDIRGERELDLIRRYQAGDRHAGEILLRAHAGFIAAQAKFWGRGRHDLEPEDILAEAQVGFLKGVEKFEPERGYQLCSYACFWIRARVAREKANTGNAIRVPVFMHGRRSKEDTERGADARRALGVLRLDAPVTFANHNDDHDVTLADRVASEEPHQEERLGTEEERVLVHEAVRQAGLTPRQLEVVRRRVLADNPETLDEIARDHGITKEAIRMTEAKALDRIERAIRRLTPARSSPP